MLNNIFLFIGIILGVLNIYQFFSNTKEKQLMKSLVRSWQNHADGIKNALLQIAMNPNNQTNKDIILGNIQALSQQAAALDKAMTEERFYDDKEVKRKKEESEKQFKDLMSVNSATRR